MLQKIFKTILLLSFLFIYTTAYAETNQSKLVKNRYDNIYAVYHASDRVHLYYAQRYTLNDITAYCIEPGLGIETDTYSSTEDWSITNLNSNVRNYIRLIAYYGYDYPGHNTMKYYLATQELIWRGIEGKEVYWVEGESIDAPKIDIEKEKQEIILLAKNHTKAPSFDNQTIELTLGKETILKDENNVLNDYEIYSSDIPNVEIVDNNLRLTTKNIVKDAEIRLIKKHYTNSVALIYHSGNNQKLIRSGILDPVIASSQVKINVKAKVKVFKTDKDYHFILKKSGFKFKIKNTDTNEYLCEYDECIYQTNNQGYFVTELLDEGHYQLEEIENQNFYDYAWNNDPISFTIDENSSFKYENDEAILEIKYPNRHVRGQITVKKLGEIAHIKNGEITYEYVPLSDVKFKLYAAENIYNGFGNLMKSAGSGIEIFKTINGSYFTHKLYLGKYCLIELETPDNYQLNEEPYCFNLEYKDKYTEYIESTITLKNYLKKGNFELIKKDKLTNKPISKTQIAIYTEKGELAYSGLTDELGQIHIENLPLGKYYYKELSPSPGYIIDNEKHYFEIEENKQTIKEELFNEPIKGTFEFLKKDYNTGTPLKDTTIGIYNEDDELLYQEITNDEGKIIIENIPYGKYYFVELAAPEGYILDSTKHYFEIKENNIIIKANMTNERIPVPNTHLNENDIAYIISLVMIIIAMFFITNKKVIMKVLGIILITIAIIIPLYRKEKNAEITKTIQIETKNYINNTSQNKKSEVKLQSKKPNYNYVAVLEIPSINLKQGLVGKYSKYNDVKYNIQIIEGSNYPDVPNTNLILAAHSGTSHVAYFKNLSNLEDNEYVYIYYNGYKYTYIINNHYEVIKTGYIDLVRDRTVNAITLITCKDDKYQIVYLGYLINKEIY